MPTLELIDTINGIPRYFDASNSTFRFPRGFLTPGALVSLTAFAHARNISRGNLDLPEDIRGYVSAVGLSRALFGDDDYDHARRREGENYATLQHLANPETTDVATSRINSCIRRFVGQSLPQVFVARLCEVVGDLHENVWAHGRASGFSMAQRWPVPWTLKRDHYLEFALADSGLGFLAEMRRVGMEVGSHRAAIEWCIREGNSTKKLRPEGNWVQYMPEDVINNPLRGVEQTRVSENHHMGLGLFKLTQLIKEFRGQLWLASGDAALIVVPDCENAYISVNHPWQGVAIACRFRASDISRAGARIEADRSIDEIMQVLGGRHG